MQKPAHQWSEGRLASKNQKNTGLKGKVRKGVQSLHGQSTTRKSEKERNGKRKG
jgi:hypothetical protein